MARMAINHRGHLQTRLQSVFSAIDRSSMEPYFYTKQFEKEKTISLIALFDNGIDPDPSFSGPIIGRIYLDREQNLTLATWPHSKEKVRPWRKEILYPKVSRFTFEFLGDKPVDKKEPFTPITAQYAWNTSWPKGSRGVPGIIRLTLYEEDTPKPLHYAFILPVSEPFITYHQEKKAI